MEFKDAFKKLQESNEFKKWKKKNKDFYLAHGFITYGKGNGEWQIGYYSKKKDVMVSFFIDDLIKISPETEVFKKEEAHVRELDVEKIKLDYSAVLEKSSSFQKEKYSNEEPSYIFVIVQNLEIGIVWNVTFVTKNFNALNMKVSAENGEILEHSIAPLMSFGKQIK